MQCTHLRKLHINCARQLTRVKRYPHFNCLNQNKQHIVIFFKILKWQNVGTFFKFYTLFDTCVLLNTQRFHEKSYFGNEINIEIDKTSD